MAEDEIDERLSRRLGDTDDDEGESGDSQNAETDMPSQPSQKNRRSQKAQNVKKEWNVRSFYLDDDLDQELTTAFKRLDLALSEEGSRVDLKKTRHYYPLIVELGLERLEQMESTEVMEQLEQME